MDSNRFKKNTSEFFSKTTRKIKTGLDKFIHTHCKKTFAGISQKTNVITRNFLRKSNIFFTALGYKACEIAVAIKDNVIYVVKHDILRGAVNAVKAVYHAAKKVCGNIKNFVAVRFNKVKRACSAVSRTWSKSKGQSAVKRPFAFIKAVFAGLFRRKYIFKTIFNYALPVVAICLCTVVVSKAAQVDFVVGVDYNDQKIGYVANESIVEDAKQMVQDRMVYLDDSEVVDINPTYSVEAITNDSDVLTEYELADKIIGLSHDDMVEAEGLYVDGKFYGAVDEVGTVEKTLEAMLDEYRNQEGNEEAEVTFTKDVQVVEGLYVTENLVDTQEIVDMITGEVAGDTYHTVSGNDTLSGIAQEYDIPSSEIYKMNPDVVPERMHEGDQILISRKVEFLSVQVKKELVYSEVIEFETKTTKSKDYAANVRKVTTEGEDGEKEITAEVTYIGGVETNRDIISTKVIKEAVAEEVIQGTAPLVGSSSSGGGVAGSSGSGHINAGFQWPVFGGYISSGYGYRWGKMHPAIDIAAWGGAYGMPIYSVAEGTVIFAGWSGAYGKLLKVDHGNGLHTWYAHCSAHLVSVGDHVSKGQQIGNIGSTGNVTGPHLHFEVRVNGNTQNPMNYLP